MLRRAKPTSQAEAQREPVHEVGVRPQDAGGRARHGNDQRAGELIETFIDVGVAPSERGAAEH
eukprot:4171491-Lingulodinium_polyedra.AAC.1